MNWRVGRIGAGGRLLQQAYSLATQCECHISDEAARLVLGYA